MIFVPHTCDQELKITLIDTNSKCNDKRFNSIITSDFRSEDKQIAKRSSNQE